MDFNKKEITDMIGEKYGMLTVIGIDKEKSLEKGKVYLYCRCDCNSSDMRSYLHYSLKSGNSTSCGCKRNNKNRERCKKYNEYDLESKEYGIGYTSSLNQDGFNEFWFDKEDYDLIKNYCWNFDNKGMVSTKPQGKIIYLHRLIMNITEHNIQIDHIKHKRYDNRKSQLRISNNELNNRNKGLVKRNTTGITGVYYRSKTNSWYAQIKVNYKIIHLGTFRTKEEAAIARRQAEEKYFGEWSYTNSQKIGNERMDA